MSPLAIAEAQAKPDTGKIDAAPGRSGDRVEGVYMLSFRRPELSVDNPAYLITIPLAIALLNIPPLQGGITMLI